MAVGLLIALPDSARAGTVARPYYVTELSMTHVVQEHHNWGKGNLEVLDAVCGGQGIPRGHFPYQRFHLFLCYVTAKGWTAQYHFQVTQKAGKIVYAPTLVTSYRVP